VGESWPEVMGFESHRVASAVKGLSSSLMGGRPRVVRERPYDRRAGGYSCRVNAKFGLRGGREFESDEYSDDSLTCGVKEVIIERNC
jgi:hypothetical protein